MNKINSERLESTANRFDPSKVHIFKPFQRGCIVFGGYFGDEGKGKEVDIMANFYKSQGYKILSTRGQGSGNAGHTVVVNGKKYDFHYLTSAGLLADIMLLGPGMIIDPIRVLEEMKKLPEEKRKVIYVAERAAIVTDMDRVMDSWCENQRSKSGKPVIGTTKSGVGPGTGNRGYRVHVTFADAKACKSYKELQDMFVSNPLFCAEALEIANDDEYIKHLWNAINELNIVDSVEVIAKCREEGDWAVLLEVSQAVGLDPLFGNGGHYTTSMPCIGAGAAWGAGLSMEDFPDGSILVIKAYGSKVGGGPYITKFLPEENHIADFIDDMVGEHGVTTGRKRDLGWLDGPAIRYAIQITGADGICVNCMDVIAELISQGVTDTVKVCYAYKHKITGEVTYGWPYFLKDYTPLYEEVSMKGLSKNDVMVRYIWLMEKIIGKKIKGYGVGPTREDYRDRTELFG